MYVDDILLTGTDIEEINNLKELLHNQFKIKDQGKLHYFLGLKILYTAMGVIISQRKFALDVLKEYQRTQFSSFTSPLDATIKLRDNEGKLLSNPRSYRKLIGKLNFSLILRWILPMESYILANLCSILESHTCKLLTTCYAQVS